MGFCLNNHLLVVLVLGLGAIGQVHGKENKPKNLEQDFFTEDFAKLPQFDEAKIKKYFVSVGKKSRHKSIQFSYLKLVERLNNFLNKIAFIADLKPGEEISPWLSTEVRNRVQETITELGKKSLLRDLGQMGALEESRIKQIEILFYHLNNQLSIAEANWREGKLFSSDTIEKLQVAVETPKVAIKEPQVAQCGTDHVEQSFPVGRTQLDFTRAVLDYRLNEATQAVLDYRLSEAKVYFEGQMLTYAGIVRKGEDKLVYVKNLTRLPPAPDASPNSVTSNANPSDVATNPSPNIVGERANDAGVVNDSGKTGTDGTDGTGGAKSDRQPDRQASNSKPSAAGGKRAKLAHTANHDRSRARLVVSADANPIPNSNETAVSASTPSDDPTKQNNSDKTIDSDDETYSVSDPHLMRRDQSKGAKIQRLKALNKVFQRKLNAQVSQLRGRGKLLETWTNLFLDKESRGKLKDNLTKDDLYVMRDQLELESYDMSTVMPDPYFKDAIAAWKQALQHLKSRLNKKSNWAEQLLTLTDEVNEVYLRDQAPIPNARFTDLFKDPIGAKRADPAQKTKLYLSLLQESGISLPQNVIPLIRDNPQGTRSVVFYDMRADKVFDPETRETLEYWDEPLISTTRILYDDVAKLNPNQKLPPQDALIRVKPKPKPIVPVTVAQPAATQPAVAQALSLASIDHTTAAHSHQVDEPDYAPDDLQMPQQKVPKKKTIRRRLVDFAKDIGEGALVAGGVIKGGLKILLRSPRAVAAFFAHLGDIDLSGADLASVNWSKIDTSKVDWSKVDVSKIPWDKMKGLNLKVDWAKVDWSKVDLPNMDWSQVDASSVNWSKIDPSKVDWSKIDLKDIDFTKIDVNKVAPSQLSSIDLLSRVAAESQRRAQGKVRNPDNFREDLRLRGRSVVVEQSMDDPVKVRGSTVGLCSEIDPECEKTIEFRVKSQEIADQLIRSRSLAEDLSIIERAYQDQIDQEIAEVADKWLNALRSPSSPPSKKDVDNYYLSLLRLQDSFSVSHNAAYDQIGAIAYHLGFVDRRLVSGVYLVNKPRKENFAYLGRSVDRRYNKEFQDDRKVISLINNRLKKEAKANASDLLKNPKIKELLVAAESYENLPKKDPMLYAGIYEAMTPQDRNNMLEFLSMVVELNHFTRAGNSKLDDSSTNAGRAYPFQILHNIPGSSVYDLTFQASFAPFSAGVIKSYRPIQAIEVKPGQLGQTGVGAVNAVSPTHVDGIDESENVWGDDVGTFQPNSVKPVHVDAVQGNKKRDELTEKRSIKVRPGEESGYEPDQIDPAQGQEWDVELLAESYLKIANSRSLMDMKYSATGQSLFNHSNEIKNMFRAFLPELSSYYLEKIRDGSLPVGDRWPLAKFLLRFYPWINSPELTPEQKMLPGIIPGTQIREDVAELILELLGPNFIRLPRPLEVISLSTDAKLSATEVSDILPWIQSTKAILGAQPTSVKTDQ